MTGGAHAQTGDNTTNNCNSNNSGSGNGNGNGSVRRHVVWGSVTSGDVLAALERYHILDARVVAPPSSSLVRSTPTPTSTAAAVVTSATHCTIEVPSLAATISLSSGTFTVHNNI
jgi:hypothetical protein